MNLIGVGTIILALATLLLAAQGRKAHRMQYRPLLLDALPTKVGAIL